MLKVDLSCLKKVFFLQFIYLWVLNVILLNINYLVQHNGACAYINGYCIVLQLERNIS